MHKHKKGVSNVDILLGIAGLATCAALAALTDAHPTARSCEARALNEGLSPRQVLINRARSLAAKAELTIGVMFCALGIAAQFIG